jgi:hypothetical protein
MSIESGEPELRRSRRMVAVFWVFTILYVVLSVALLVTRGAFGLIYVAILAWSWFFQGWPDTKPHFKVLREARQTVRAARDA